MLHHPTLDTQTVGVVYLRVFFLTCKNLLVSRAHGSAYGRCYIIGLTMVHCLLHQKPLSDSHVPPYAIVAKVQYLRNPREREHVRRFRPAYLAGYPVSLHKIDKRQEQGFRQKLKPLSPNFCETIKPSAPRGLVRTSQSANARRSSSRARLFIAEASRLQAGRRVRVERGSGGC